MPSIAASEARLRADNRPVLFLDTCVIVDIIRATLRCMGTNFVQSAVEFRGLLKSAPPGCALVVASMVPTEWGNHAPRTRDEVRGHLGKIQDQAQHFHAACGALGVGLAYGLPAYPVANLHDRLFDLSKEILDLAAVLDSDGECATRAIARVVAKLAPSKQGREMKDCVILEECLELTLHHESSLGPPRDPNLTARIPRPIVSSIGESHAPLRRFASSSSVACRYGGRNARRL
jgi:hypothetical protein